MSTGAEETPLICAGGRRPATVATVGSISLVLVQAVQLSGASAPGAIDSAVSAATTGWFESLDGVWDAIEDVGDLGASVAICVAVAATLVAVGLRRFALLAALGPAVAGLGVVVLKPTVGRTMAGVPSFPSGHVTAVTAVALVVALVVVRRTRVRRTPAAAAVGSAALIAAVVTGIAVVVAGVHYPSDVLGGLCTAVAGVLGTALVLDALPTGRSATAR